MKAASLKPFAIALLMAATALAQTRATIAANDNRTPAGQLCDGVLHLELNIDKGSWYPESDDGEHVPAYVFGEAGKALQAPGPTIRVPQGTTIDISLHNSLAVHVTAARKKPAIVLFGPTSSAEIELYGRGAKITPPGLDCLCCYLPQCDKAPHCQALIAPETVLAAVQQWLVAR